MSTRIRFQSKPVPWLPWPGLEWSPFLILVFGGFVQFLAMIWFVLLNLEPTSVPPMLWSTVATPLAFLIALAWTGLRIMGWTAPHTAGGFSLVGLGLAARAHCELLVWTGGGPGVEAIAGGQVPPPTLVTLVRYGGATAYIAGLVLVVCSTIVAASNGERHPVHNRVASGIALGLVLAFSVGFTIKLVTLWIPLLKP